MTTGQTERTGQDGLPGPATGEGTARALTTLPACAMTFSTTRLFLLGALGLRLVANLGVSPTVPSSMLVKAGRAPVTSFFGRTGAGAGVDDGLDRLSRRHRRYRHVATEPAYQ